MTETKIYVGLNDADTLRQEHDTEVYISLLQKVCCSYHVSFSFTVAQGGYIHEDGRYTQEKSLVVTLIDTDKDLVEEIARDLCAFFHQESVMITEDTVRVYYISEPSLEEDK